MRTTDDTTVETDHRRVEGHTFESAYEVGDVGETYVATRIEEMGLTAEKWGIDMRDRSDVRGDHRPDFKVRDQNGRLVGVVESKSKTSEDWLWICNRHHLGHYCYHAYEREVPVWVYFNYVDDSGQEPRIVEDGFIQVPDWDGLAPLMEQVDWDIYARDDASWEGLKSCPIVERIFRAPDGHMVVSLDESRAEDWSSVAFTLQANGMEVEVDGGTSESAA